MSWFLNAFKHNTYVYYENVFSNDEIDLINLLGDSSERIDATINQGEVNIDIRTTKISWINPEKTSEWLYRKLTDVINAANESYFQLHLVQIQALQYTIYHSGGFYKPHIDIESVSAGMLRKLSFSVMLSNEEEYEGGNLNIISSSIPESVPSKKGTIVFFPSYMLHEVTKVTTGTRKALVGWVTGPGFK